MEHLKFMNDFLRKNNYPLIESMSHDQIADIFNKSNRCFLVSWSLKLLNDVYEEVLENSDCDKEVLGSFVYELGFCTKNEFIPFMGGELAPDQQVAILNKIFRYIEDVKNANNLRPEDLRTVSIDDIVNLKNTNLNLYPMFGKIKTLTQEERAHKIDQLTKTLAELTSGSIGPADNHKDKEVEEIDISKCNMELVQTFKNVKDNFKQIRQVSQAIIKERSYLVPEVNYEVNPDAGEILKKCSEYLQTILQFINDIHTINEFENNFSNLHDLEDPTENDATLDEITNMLATLSQEASRVSRKL